MIAEEGGTMNVSGSTIATPFTEPRPGMAPMNRPAVTPIRTTMMLKGDRDVAKPSARRARMSIFAASQKKVA